MAIVLNNYNKTPSDILTQIANICLYHLMLNCEAMKKCQSMNYQGFKRKHRCNSHIFLKFLNCIENYSIDMYENELKTDVNSLEYNPTNIKKHLEIWNAEIMKSVDDLGILNKKFMDVTGFNCKMAEKIKDHLFKDHHKIIRWYKHVDNGIIMFEIDSKLHEKYKEKEANND
jgi:hypothetical protein